MKAIAVFVIKMCVTFLFKKRDGNIRKEVNGLSLYYRKMPPSSIEVWPQHKDDDDVKVKTFVTSSD